MTELLSRCRRAVVSSLFSLFAIVVLSLSSSHAIAANKIVGWGMNENYQLDDATQINRFAPINTGHLANVIQITGGYYHMLAVRSDYKLLTWGNNTDGQLGNGTNANRSTPTALAGIPDVIGAGAGGSHSLLITAGGSVYTWGLNSSGQLGHGNTQNSNRPAIVTGLTGIKAVAGGNDFSVALKSDGTVWAWGNNALGQLGDGTTTQRLAPVQVIGASGITAISPGSNGCLALKDDGTVWRWGWFYGEATVTSAVQVVGLSGIVAIGGGSNHALALTGDGTVWAWGAGFYGELGNGDFGTAPTPIQVPGLSGILSIVVAGTSNMARKFDGKVWSWGHNFVGQLGDGSNTISSTPIRVRGISNASYIAAAWSARFATVDSTTNSGLVAIDDMVAVAPDSSANEIAVLANDYDLEGQALQIISVTQGQHGTATFTSSSISYTPQAGYRGSDVFTYWVYNGNGTTETASVRTETTEASSLVVTTASDESTNYDDLTSLREAIAYANTHTGPDAITFAISGSGLQTIQLTAALPALTDNGTTIDGYSQDGSITNASGLAAPEISINGTGLTTGVAGLTIQGSDCTVTGLDICRCPGGGIIVQGGSGNDLRGNTLHHNAGLGIDLLPVGEASNSPTTNDSDDTDDGPNNLQNFPSLAVFGHGTNWAINGELHSLPNSDYTVDIYSNSAAHASGFGEGEFLLGTVTVHTDSNGLTSFELEGAGSDAVFTAMATDENGNTSEFSRAVTRVIDNIAPTIALSSLTAHGANAGVAGTAGDSGASGLGQVTVALRRLATESEPIAYFNWSSQAFDLEYNDDAHEKAVVGSTNWHLALPSLPAGHYQLRATANDLALNQTATPWIELNDTTAPTIVLTNPAINNAKSHNLTQVSGSAEDPSTEHGAGSGLARVKVRIYRPANGSTPAGYWAGGDTWTPGYSSANDIVCTGTTQWSLAVALPDGRYSIAARATDKAGNTGTYAAATHSVTIESTPPTVSVNRPANDMYYKTVNASGTAADSSGIVRVTGVLRQLGYGYWNGSTWTANFSAANELLCSGTTNWSLAFPALPTGYYTFHATAIDSFGNTTSSADHSFRIDTVAPTVVIQRMYNKASNVVSGTGFDESVSSGIALVSGLLYRYANGSTPAGYWGGGANWNETFSDAHYRPCTGIANWSMTLPTLPEGEYYYRARIVDNMGNVGYSSIWRFTVEFTPPTITFTQPTHDYAVGGTNFAVRGTVADGGSYSSNVTRITMMLYRYANGSTAAGYWLGDANWSSNYSSSNEILAGSDTSFSLSLTPFAEGNYSARVSATDHYGNTGRSSILHFTIDRTAPTVALLQPSADNVALKNSPTAKGTATDFGSPAGGLDRVTGLLYRYSNGGTPAGYWAGGNNWTTSYAPANEILCSGSADWSLALPALAEGGYSFRATAIDKAGNIARTAVTRFSIDRSAPTLTVITPAPDNASFSSLPQAQGTAADAAPGSGIVRVTGMLFRYANGGTPAGYWAGGAVWTETYSDANEMLCSGTSTWSLALPPLSAGKYSFRASATDRAGNVARTAVTRFTLDRVAPVIVLTRPAPDSTSYPTLAQANGTATDSAPGSGVIKVTGMLFRYVNGGTPAGYWAGGNNWSATYTEANELLATGTTNWTFNLPVLPAGNYSFRATATDKAGNFVRSAINRFSITGPAPAPQAAAAPQAAVTSSGLSAATARAATGTVTLSFNTALDADSAGDAAHYTATVNGVAVEIAAVAYTPASHSVTLTLNAGTLHAGDAVTVTWNELGTTGGSTLDGQAGPLTAQ